MSARVDVLEVLDRCEAYVEDAVHFPEHFKPGVVKRHMTEYRESREAVAAAIKALETIANSSGSEDGCYYTNRGNIRIAREALVRVKGGAA